MSHAEHIRTTFERVANAISRRPSLGQSTAVSVTRVTAGLRCESQEGPWRIGSDMPANAGGSASAPTPGVLGRAALGSCLAMGITMYAAKLGIAIDALEVEVQADSDDGALFGVSDTLPGYTEVRYAVRIDSGADEDAVRHMLDEAERHSPYLDVFRRAQVCRRSVHINGIAER